MTKTDTRKRLLEARVKCMKVALYGAKHMSPADAKKCLSMAEELQKIASKCR